MEAGTNTRTIWIVVMVLCVTMFTGCRGTLSSLHTDANNDSSVEKAFKSRSSNVHVVGEGVVSRILPDDTSGLTHQRFIVRLASGQTVLIEYNTDIAPKIEDLGPGDTVGFSGEYVWNEQGGLVHWTHHDPAGKHEAGWLKFKEQTYQ